MLLVTSLVSRLTKQEDGCCKCRCFEVWMELKLEDELRCARTKESRSVKQVRAAIQDDVKVKFGIKRKR